MCICKLEWLEPAQAWCSVVGRGSAWTEQKWDDFCSCDLFCHLCQSCKRSKRFSHLCHLCDKLVWQTCPKAFQGVLRGSHWWQGGGAAKASKTHSYYSTNLHTIDIILLQLGSNSWRDKVNTILTKVNSFKAVFGCSLAIVFQLLGPCSFKKSFDLKQLFKTNKDNTRCKLGGHFRGTELMVEDATAAHSFLYIFTKSATHSFCYLCIV